MFEIQSPENMTSSGEDCLYFSVVEGWLLFNIVWFVLFFNIRTNWTGPGVRTRKRPLLASQGICNTLLKVYVYRLFILTIFASLSEITNYFIVSLFENVFILSKMTHEKSHLFRLSERNVFPVIFDIHTRFVRTHLHRLTSVISHRSY